MTGTSMNMERMSADEFQELLRRHNEAADAKPSHATHGHWESDLQIACVNWFRLQYPWPRYLITAVPNGGLRDRVTAKILRAEGVWSGIPDLYIPMPRKGYTALYIEMKNGKAGRVSDSQRETMAFLEREGAKCVVCRDFDSFVDLVNYYLK